MGMHSHSHSQFIHHQIPPLTTTHQTQPIQHSTVPMPFSENTFSNESECVQNPIERGDRVRVMIHPPISENIDWTATKHSSTPLMPLSATAALSDASIPPPPALEELEPMLPLEVPLEIPPMSQMPPMPSQSECDQMQIPPFELPPEVEVAMAEVPSKVEVAHHGMDDLSSSIGVGLSSDALSLNICDLPQDLSAVPIPLKVGAAEEIDEDDDLPELKLPCTPTSTSPKAHCRDEDDVGAEQTVPTCV